MDYEIVWSDEAKSSFEAIVNYLLHYFTEREVAVFISSVNKKIELISANPTNYWASSKYKSIHFTNISRKTLLIYRIQSKLNRVELIHFWDGRQDPKKFKI